MSTYRGYPLFNVAEPQTKGIVRAKASHLSLCLEPLVAQRSILFRIQTELGEKEGYNQLSAESDYSSLQLISAQPDPSLSLSSKPDVQSRREDELEPSSSLLSTASVYSQDSWDQNPVPTIPSSSPSPTLEPEPPAKVQQESEPGGERRIHARPAPANGSDEHRRYAMALSPSMDWELGAVASPSLVPLDLATRFIVDVKLLKKDSSDHKKAVQPATGVKTSTKSKIISTGDSDSPTTPTTADPFRAGGDAGGSFFLFQPDPPDQGTKKLKKKSVHAHSRTLSESHTSAKSSTSLRRALSRLTFAAPSRDRADLPAGLRRTKSQLISPPPLTPAANSQLPALRFSPIQLRLPTIPSAVTPSTSDPFKRAESPLVVTGLMTPGPAAPTDGVKKEKISPLPPPPTAPPPPLHRRTALKKAAPDTVRKSHPPQLPTIPSTPSVPADELKVNEHPPLPPAPPPVPPLPPNPPLIPRQPQQPTHTVAVLKQAPPPRLPLVSHAPQVQPKRVHRRYASSPAVLNFRPQDLPAMPPPPLPDLNKRLVELDRLQMQRNTLHATALRGGA